LRLSHVLKLIEAHLGEAKVSVLRHEIDENIEYLNVRVEKSKATLVIREYWRKGKLVAYGYYVRVKGHEEWWDNRPHHPEVVTYPHHKHVMNKVEPLFEPSLEKFMERVRELLRSL